jgi:hypothetical protein
MDQHQDLAMAQVLIRMAARVMWVVLKVSGNEDRIRNGYGFGYLRIREYLFIDRDETDIGRFNLPLAMVVVGVFMTEDEVSDQSFNRLSRLLTLEQQFQRCLACYLADEEDHRYNSETSEHVIARFMFADMEATAQQMYGPQSLRDLRG